MFAIIASFRMIIDTALFFSPENIFYMWRKRAEHEFSVFQASHN